MCTSNNVFGGFPRKIAGGGTANLMKFVVAVLTIIFPMVNAFGDTLTDYFGIKEETDKHVSSDTATITTPKSGIYQVADPNGSDGYSAANARILYAVTNYETSGTDVRSITICPTQITARAYRNASHNDYSCTNGTSKQDSYSTLALKNPSNATSANCFTLCASDENVAYYGPNCEYKVNRLKKYSIADAITVNSSIDYNTEGKMAGDNLLNGGAQKYWCAYASTYKLTYSSATHPNINELTCNYVIITGFLPNNT